MNSFLFAVLFIAAPLASATYGSSSSGHGHGHGHGHGASYISGASSSGLDELVQAAAGGAHNSGSSIAPANAEIQNESADAARLGQVQAQLQALNSNPVYRNLKNSDAIAESLAQSKLASSIRRGNINIVAPNVVDQGVYRSLLVPSGQNNHQVIATQPLPPIVVNQPPMAPTVIGGGPAAVVKAAPVIYKIKPSVIYQQEVINKVPTPLSLNPVYVKVYKPGKKVDAPLVPGVQKTYTPSYSAPSYQPQSYDTAPASSYGAAPATSYGAAQSHHSHHSHHSYEAAPAASYSPAASYDSEPSYGPAPSASPSYGSAPASSSY